MELSDGSEGVRRDGSASAGGDPEGGDLSGELGPIFASGCGGFGSVGILPVVVADGAGTAQFFLPDGGKVFGGGLDGALFGNRGGTGDHSTHQGDSGPSEGAGGR